MMRGRYRRSLKRSLRNAEGEEVFKMSELWRRGAILRMLGNERLLHAIIGALLALLILGFFYWMGLD
jgi:hypothetical protein